MFHRMSRLAAIAALPLWGVGTASPAQERLASHCLAMAAGPETVLPARLGDGLEADHVLIRYLHHASFAIVSAEGTVVDFHPELSRIGA